MMEKVIKFGRHDHLVGIITLPDDREASFQKPAILFLNAGLLHRIGPYRLHVDLGRALTSDGCITMRFDLSGIGDSQFTAERAEYKENVKNDIQDAMNFIQQKYNIDRFELVGLCSGAANAQMVAAVDHRIIGAVMMDGFAYRTPGFYYHLFKPHLKNPFHLITAAYKILLQRLRKVIRKPGGEPAKISMFSNIQPPRKQVAAEFVQLVQRGVAMLCIYSGGISAYYNYANQFKDMFGSVDFKGLLQLHYFKDADHTYTAYDQRKKLIACIRQWINEHENLAV